MTPTKKEKAILRAVCKKNSITLKEFLGPCRSQHLVWARVVASKALKKLKPEPTSIRIGEVINRDHTTVLNLLKK